ncbi:hypothetical protein NEOLEDRAFT_1180705 [Neolentinus lepideus HHB14362 ss-1]|uniref:Uncharacterized protein n=1 Tax=Neolentinus lepideus HHB14362 ss-1 TaxID=1314782 RepID=A0A165QMB8_9AGAM|nr:hypothetical protein NEOLEDRAFT_1180705 [Neolentinus lepideus HHB14362 ss-1]
MSNSSLSSVVSGLVRAQMGSSVPSTITDEDLDRHVADLILKEAKRKAERYASQGIRAYLPEAGSNAPKTNKRFLSSIIRNTDEHNKTILRAKAQAAQEIKQQREEQERRERRARAEEAAEAERLRRRGRDSSHDRWHSSKRRERSWERRDNYGDDEDRDRERRRKSSRRHRHGDDGRSRHHRSSGQTRLHSIDPSEDADHRHRSQREEDEERSSRRKHDKKRARSDSEDLRSDRRGDRDHDKKRARSRSRSFSDSEDLQDRTRRSQDHSRGQSRDHTDDDLTPGPSRKPSDSRSRSRNRHRPDSTTSSTRPSPPPEDQIDREAELRAKLKGKGKVLENAISIESSRKSRHTRTNSKNPSRSPSPEEPHPPITSKMDKYFETSYDPRLDVAPLKVPEIPATGLIDDAAFEGWDAMLKIIELRRQDKVEKKWLAKHGIKESSSSKETKGGTSSSERWDSGPSIMDIEYKKRGAVREWDLCKETPT